MCESGVVGLLANRNVQRAVPAADIDQQRSAFQGSSLFKIILRGNGYSVQRDDDIALAQP